MTVVRHIPETKLHRLGRHVEHDPDSRSFALPHDATAPLVSAVHVRHVPVFDQGDLGSCTCEAMVGALMTGPFYSAARVLGQADCVDLYKQATRLDKIPGHYPPDDTGSSGLAAAKAAHKRGWLRAYHHAFTPHAALLALGRAPIIIGVNWYAGFDSPVGPRAELVIAGEVRGGHEVCVTEIDVTAQTIRGPNSWGPGWGDGGYWSMSFDTFRRLMYEQGDAVAPVV